MPSKQLQKNTHLQQSAGDNADVRLSTSQLVAKTKTKQIDLINNLLVKPGAQKRVTLGSFDGANLPMGFSIEVTPNPNPVGSVLTEVRSLVTAGHHKFILLITNYGLKSISAKVSQL